MSKPRIALVVGNGFSMSFGAHSGLARLWNSQNPLQWNIRSPRTLCPLRDHLPNLYKIVDAHRQDSDFDIFARVLDVALCRQKRVDPLAAVVEARHYLAIAYSAYSLEQVRAFDSTWPWFKWLQVHRENIIGAVSYNYDLLLETCLDKLGLGYHSFQINHHGHALPLVKPHGSVDFEMDPTAIAAPQEYPLRNLVELCNSNIVRLPFSAEALLTPRLQALCILPGEANKYRHFMWVAPAYERFAGILKSCTHCVFVGTSYSPADRPELDALVGLLPVNAQVVVANPCPPEDFLRLLTGRAVMSWESQLGPISDSGELLVLKSRTNGRMLPMCPCRSGLSYHYCHGAGLRRTA